MSAKYVPLMFSGIRAQAGAAVLTALSMAVAFMLFGLLEGTSTLFDKTLEKFGTNRLVVASRTSDVQLLPMAILDTIEKTPGVQAVSFQTLFIAAFQQPKNAVPALAVDIDRYIKVYPEVHVTPAEQKSMSEIRDGAVIGKQLAARFGWKSGDHITLQSRFWAYRDGSHNWPLDIVGIFDSPEGGPHSRGLLFNHRYFDEARQDGQGMIGGYIVKADSPRAAAQVGAAIDAEFANSSNRTRTQSENERAYSQLMEMGDIKFVLRAVLGAVFFTLVFLAANTMSQSISNRMREFAALRAMGFTNRAISALIFFEAFIMCEAAVLLGLAGATAIFEPITRHVLGTLSGKMPSSMLGLGVLVAATIALATSVGPATRATRMTIAEGLMHH